MGLIYNDRAYWIRKGAEEAHTKALAWLARQEKAREEGVEFNEPPPFRQPENKKK